MNRKFIQILTVISTLTLLLFSCSDDPVAPVTTGTIRGQVVDAETQNILAGASITTTPATNAITTNAQGDFIIPEVEEGKFTITATKSGYKKGIVSVNVLPGDTAQASIQLNPDDDFNRVPEIPDHPVPANGSEMQPVVIMLHWRASDPDPADTLTYDVYLYENNQPGELVAKNLAADSLLLDSLQYSTTYFWQVVAKDNNAGVTNGPVWRFTTESFPDNPVVFASQNSGNYNIYTADTDTLDFRQVVLNQHPARDWWPRWHPDRTRLAFVSDRSIEPQIYTMDEQGGSLLKVTTVPVTGYHNYGLGFCWSPDGYQLLYGHYEKLYRIDANGTNLQQIAAAPAERHFREVDWTPVGDKIVALTIGSWFYDSEIYLMDADGSNMSLLVDNWPGAITSPSFSPDGQKVIFSHDFSGYEVSSGRQLDAHIVVIDIAGGDTTDISLNKPSGTNDLYPRFSPDGSKIIFTNAPNNQPEAQSVWVMDLNGDNRRKLVSSGTMPDWR
ncbi:MAG: carboxypeptidase regulatory-like domain-containing protein [Calditrichia bacterium]